MVCKYTVQHLHACVWEKKKGNGSYRESQTQKGWCNEVIILLLSTVRKLFLTLIDASGRIIWHFHTGAGTRLEMSDCPTSPPLPSLSTSGVLSLMWLGEHVYVCTYPWVCTLLCPVSKVTAEWKVRYPHHRKSCIFSVLRFRLFFKCFFKNYSRDSLPKPFDLSVQHSVDHQFR